MYEYDLAWLGICGMSLLPLSVARPDFPSAALIAHVASPVAQGTILSEQELSAVAGALWLCLSDCVSSVCEWCVHALVHHARQTHAYYRTAHGLELDLSLINPA